jgi:hypothetical protein
VADLATDHQLGIWDAVILAAASQSGCRLLLFEDLQHGFSWGGLTVVNPSTIRITLCCARIERSQRAIDQGLPERLNSTRHAFQNWTRYGRSAQIPAIHRRLRKGDISEPLLPFLVRPDT